MAADTPTPLATAAEMQQGQFADLVRSYTPTALADLMVEATRLCEDACGRRLAPFTGLPETHRAQGVDPDELTDSANLPMDIQGTLGRSYSNALGGQNLVRHVWLNEFAPRYPDLWTYANVTVTIVRSYGGSQTMAVSQLTGPEPDSGHTWFQLGTFLPVGSLIRVTYDGGYSTVPASLVRSCKLMAASLAVNELDPVMQTGHDPVALRSQAETVLAPWVRP